MFSSFSSLMQAFPSEQFISRSADDPSQALAPQIDRCDGALLGLSSEWVDMVRMITKHISPEIPVKY